MRAGLALASAVLVLAGCGSAEGDALLPPGGAIAASTSVAPAVHLFGDPVVARLQLIVDRRQLDPKRIDARARFDPYERVGDVQVSRRDFGQYTRVTYEFALRCLEAECVLAPASSGVEPVTGGRRTFRFEPARILYAESTRDAPSVLRFAQWPPLESLSRINTAQFQGSQFPFRASTSPLPAVTHRVPPALLATLCLLGGLGLLIPAGRRVGGRFQSRRPAPIEQTELDVPPLERALMLVEATQERGDVDRRTALEELASELHRTGFEEPAADVTEVAWSRTSPTPEAITAVVQRVRSEVGAAT